MSNQTTEQSFDRLPDDAYYVSNERYSGLSNVSNASRNNEVSLASNMRVTQLKGKNVHISSKFVK